MVKQVVVPDVFGLNGKLGNPECTVRNAEKESWLKLAKLNKARK